MKEEIKVSVVQLKVELLRPEKNIARMREFIRSEAEAGQELIVFPELANTGYIAPVNPGGPVGVGDMTFAEFSGAYAKAAEKIPGPTTDSISELTRKYGVYVIVGMAEKHPVIPATLHNTGVLIGPEGIIGVHHKVHLPLNEKLFFLAGDKSEVFHTELGAIGIEVCYDSRFPELARIQALKGAEIICCINAIAKVLAEVTPQDTLYHRAYQRANENMLYFVCSNCSGIQGSAHCTGRSAMAAPNGTLLAFSETDGEEVIRAVLKEEEIVNCRRALNVFQDRRPELYKDIILNS